MTIPFDKVVEQSDFSKNNGLIRLLDRVFNLLWFFCIGWLLALNHIFFGTFLTLTLVGIPLARQHWKLLRMSAFPLGKVLVPATPASETPAYRAVYPEALSSLQPDVFSSMFGGKENRERAGSPLALYLRERLDTVWTHLDLLRNEPHWSEILEALFSIDPKRIFSEVSPSEFATHLGQHNPLLKTYVESQANWSNGMSVGWMLLALDSMTDSCPWSKQLLSSFRSAFDRVPREVLPREISLGLTLSANTWPHDSLRDFLSKRKPPEFPDSPPLKDFSQLNKALKDWPSWIHPTPLDSPAKALWWLESKRQESDEERKRLQLLDDLPDTLRDRPTGTRLTAAQKGRYLASWDQLLDAKVRYEDPAADILYPAFQFLANNDKDFQQLWSEIYVLCPAKARYRKQEVSYPKIDVFWCWECRDWLPLAQRSYKHNQCNLCHLGG